jgi:O-methyltransferase
MLNPLRIKAASASALEFLIVRQSTRPTGMGRFARRMAARITAEGAVRKCEEIFVQNGNGSKYGAAVRAAMLERFKRIDREVPIKTSQTDGLFMAEAMLSLECPGAVVECGCFSGGSTAKLSIVARTTGRELLAFDSFQGLPAVDAYETQKIKTRQPMSFVATRPWRAGQYAAGLPLVRDHVERFGELSVCRFVEGWFSDTLAKSLPEPIAFAFADVDLPSSARECLLHIWPRLAQGGIFFSHDVGSIKVLQALASEQLWKHAFHEHPPIIFGAGYGMSDASRQLGFAVKGPVTPDYIKSLTFEK